MNVNSSATNNPTIGEWIQLNTKRLHDAGVGSARLDCLILLEQRLPQNRASILAHLDDTLTDEVLQKLDNDIRLRVQHIPTQYIIGKAEFYGRPFFVSGDVLVPRPESESIITLLKTLPLPRTIIDVGTGSGCLALTAKLELPETHVIGLDVDDSCLRLARSNAAELHAAVDFVNSDVLSKIEPQTTKAPLVIIANLPYVPTDFPVNDAAKHEPALALFGGDDGLDLYRKLWEQLSDLAVKPNAVVCESLESQHESLARIATHHGFSLVRTEGLAQLYAPAD